MKSVVDIERLFMKKSEGLVLYVSSGDIKLVVRQHMIKSVGS